MQQWLVENRESYEFFLLHAILHDPMRRSSLLGLPLIPEDFIKDESALLLHAITTAISVTRAIGTELEFPPTREFMKSYVNASTSSLGLLDEDYNLCMELLQTMMDPSHKEQYYCIDPYLTAWYSSIRAKRAANSIQRDVIPNVREQIQIMQTAINASEQASIDDEEDDMELIISGESEDHVVRRSTGIAGLDRALNGGLGNGECYLIFGGWGGGKSVAAGQVAWNEAATGGHVLIVSTELKPREYVARITSAAATIPIGKLQDCENFKQIRAAVMSDPSLVFKTKILEDTLAIIAERIRIKKVSSGDGLDARAIMEREILNFERLKGVRPTLVILDWLGSAVEIKKGASSGEVAMAWEHAAHGCVKLAEDADIPIVVLAQAVNSSQRKRVLLNDDIGISKGIGKNMVAVIGITNMADSAGVKAAEAGLAEAPKSKILDNQFFCMVKARKGMEEDIPMKREMKYQRFVAREKG